MDKLEKALKKARQQRGEQIASPAPLTQRTESSAALPAAKIKLSDKHLEANHIVANQPHRAEADIFRLLRTQVLQTLKKEKLKTLAVTSANYGDGKTTTAINLAISIAMDMKQTVLLVDLDLRKPCIHKYLGLNPEHGLTDHLAGDATIPNCLVRLPFERLSLLPTGKKHIQSSEILGSPKMAALAHELKTRYPDRLIIYDMPPILTQDDPLTFLPHVDSVLMVVKEGETRQDEVLRCLEILQDANVIGTVLNDCL